MYTIFSQSKSAVIATVAAASLLAAGPALAEKVKPGKPGMNDIATIAIEANNSGVTAGLFDTLLAAATCDFFEGDVLAVLTGEDKVTLFAPIDPAFDALGLNADNVCVAFNGEEGNATPAALFNILAYHLTEGRRFSNSVFNKNGNMKELEMLNGGYVISEDKKLFDSSEDATEVLEGFANINASNGVIHVVNKVLLP
jgi:transforming growth factor-beta-induced protein